ncbi:hypothetical protein AB0O07_18330 [Streptomyces sp. NPDC093085]|uniref:hypothetical protein n=1 Tax=Streptomyces sp. NPDC093085 TaxID=3155068 RepID=UPI00342A262C
MPSPSGSRTSASASATASASASASASATVALTLGLALALAGCSAAAVPSPDVPRLASFDSGEPRSWVLPLQAYLPTDQEMGQLSQAKKILVGDCMKGFGFSWTPAPELPRIGPKTLTDWRYGIHDMALAKERGYKVDAAEQEAYDAAFAKSVDDGTGAADGPEVRALEGGSREVEGKKVPEGGCVGEANRGIDADAVQARGALGLANAAFMKSQQTPEVVKAFAEWSACMKRSGYHYKAPLDASDDSKFSAPEVTAEEIATATADITCRERTRVAWIWFQAEYALQKRALEEHAEDLSAERGRIDAAVRKAAQVVTGTEAGTAGSADGADGADGAGR